MRFIENNKINTKAKIIFILLFLGAFLMNSSAMFGQRKYVIVIDAGHGGKDPGNLGNGYREKNIVLKVALSTGKKLSENKDIEVIYTRKSDVFIDLWKRGDIANHAKADLFVSIHCDSHTSNAYGAGTFVLGLRGNKKNLEIAKRENASILLEENYEEKYEGFDPNSVESVIGLSLLQEENLDKSLAMASLMQNNFTLKLKRHDRKVKQDNFQVLRETIMPSVLVELGFLTNKNEGKYLNSSKGQEQMGNAISDAILKYVHNLKLNTVVNTEQETETTNFIEYKVQIASGRKKIATKSYNFKKLKGVQRVKISKYYKYYYGTTSNYQSAVKSLKKAKSKGYTSAFIVAFNNGEKISVKDAAKMQ
ncbi:N-acetylmuramoyl-L-alanine amidase [uncultured Polaribacter sp.]|uniref:N-acetylmuramoyl-L-alanine amidase family protein n=1 Tax=uncultured Polaribacter sp. TaxID=174711 RepID=UPI002619C1C5|nr:N-acetylmuramoyl-L-alanine amidase [uncultured Polaribacter sp.]